MNELQEFYVAGAGERERERAKGRENEERNETHHFCF